MCPFFFLFWFALVCLAALTAIQFRAEPRTIFEEFLFSLGVGFVEVGSSNAINEKDRSK
jgi:hypothetical protein